MSKLKVCHSNFYVKKGFGKVTSVFFFFETCDFQRDNTSFEVGHFDSYYVIYTQFVLTIHNKLTYSGKTVANHANLLPNNDANHIMANAYFYSKAKLLAIALNFMRFILYLLKKHKSKKAPFTTTNPFCSAFLSFQI